MTNEKPGLQRLVLFSLFATSYTPLFALVAAKQLSQNIPAFDPALQGWSHPGGFITHFGLSVVFSLTAASGCTLAGDTVTFERRIDCIYLFAENRFYIFNKKNFESIVAIEQKFKAVAQRVKRQIVHAGLVETLEDVHEIIASDTGIHKKLFHLSESVDLADIDAARVRKMQEVARSYELPLRVEDGKIRVTNREELVTFMRLLEDYFLESPQTGFKYGAPVKERWITSAPRRAVCAQHRRRRRTVAHRAR
jgi:hypothetical protein